MPVAPPRFKQILQLPLPREAPKGGSHYSLLPFIVADFRLQERDRRDMYQISPRNADDRLIKKVASEKEITEQFVALVSPRFELWPQVTLKHVLGQTLRIDFVGRERANQYKGWIGFELKRGAYDHFRNFTCAVKQAIDYMHCAIQSDLANVSDVFNQRLRHIYVYPCPFAVREFHKRREGPIDLWAQGLVRLAGRFGVGVITEEGELTLAGHPIYDLDTGRVRQLAAIHQASNKFGSC